MFQIFSTTSLRVLSRTGMKFANALMLTSIFLSNVTGVVQASGSLELPKQPQNILASIGSIEEVYHAAVFSHPRSRMEKTEVHDVDTIEQDNFALISNQQQGYQANLMLLSTAMAYLSDLSWVSAVNGWGPVERDRSNGETGATDGHTITLNGVTYTKGLGVHAYSDIRYNLNQAYSLFLSDIGVDDEACGSGTVVFQVFVDGIKKFDSGLMGVNSTTQKISLSVAGANELRLYVTDGGNGATCDHADWASALVMNGTITDPDVSIIDVPSNPISANGIEIGIIQITLKDHNGLPVADHSVTVNVSGSGNTISPASAQTDVNGSASFTLNSTKAETKTITVFDQTQAILLSSKPTITFVPGPVSPQKSTVITDLTEAANDGVARATITVTALDANDNPVPGVTVNVSASGSSVLVQLNTITDSLGKSSASITDTTPELVTVSAMINNTQIPQTVDVRFHFRTNGDLIIPTGDTCNLAAGTYTFNNLAVQAGGVLNLLGNTSLNQGVTINAANITIATGGKVSADGTGYPGSSQGPGAGQNPNPIWTGGGGGYGGIGQNGDAPGRVTYGSAAAPIDLGSSGGLGKFIFGATVGGAGGGAIHLHVSDTLIVNGDLSADGVAPNGDRAGGGSGGSIYLETGTLSGNGLVHAKGGSGIGGGSGGGGRMAIYAATSNNTITFSVAGGNGWAVAGEGTIYFDTLDLANSTMGVDPSSVIADGTASGTVP